MPSNPLSPKSTPSKSTSHQIINSPSSSQKSFAASLHYQHIPSLRYSCYIKLKTSYQSSQETGSAKDSLCEMTLGWLIDARMRTSFTAFWISFSFKS